MLSCKTCGKEFANYRQLNGHMSSHRRGAEYAVKRKSPTTAKQKDAGEYICPHCNKVCIGKNSFSNHSRLCPKNPLRSYTSHTTNIVAWNKGLTKDTSDIIQKQSENAKGKKSGFTSTHRHSTKTKEKISETMAAKGHRQYVASKRHFYKGILLDSTWELQLAQDLDANSIRWERPGPLIYFDANGQKRRYYPDFFLPDFNVYLDPKNDYLRKRDIGKIEAVQSQNNVLIYCLSSTQLSWNIVKEMIL